MSWRGKPERGLMVGEEGKGQVMKWLSGLQ